MRGRAPGAGIVGDRPDAEVGERAHDDHDPTYTVGNVTFSTAIALPELVAHPGRPRFVRHRVHPPETLTGDEERAFVDDERAEFLVTTRAPFITLTFPRRARFTLETISGSVHIARPSETTDETVRHLLLDHVVPRIALTDRDIVLHASVVEKDGRALAFIGPSGAGKSTMAVALARRGCALLSDDALFFAFDDRGLCAVPSYGGARLFPDHARALVGDARGEPVAHDSDKLRFTPAALGVSLSSERRAPLARIYILERGDDETFAPDVHVSELAHRDALFALLSQAFRLDATDPEESAFVFQALSRTEILARCRGLRAPHRRDAIVDVERAIERDLARSESADSR